MLVDAIGWIGAGAVLAAFYLVSAERIKAVSPLYAWLNLVGSIAIAINTGIVGAFPSMVLNIIWAGIALVSLKRHGWR